MTTRYTEFLVYPTKDAPSSLPESIRQVGNLSAGFCRSWLLHEISDALTTSEEAFQLFDHIQNELIRYRDEKSKRPGWASDPFQLALNATVGHILEPATPNDKTFFLSCSPGAGVLPQGASPAPLTLISALNKLKHRSPSGVNFTVTHSNEHFLYIFTNSGMNKPDTISEINVQLFCRACKTAAAAV